MIAIEHDMSISVRDLTVICEHLENIPATLWREVFKHASASQQTANIHNGGVLQQLLDDQHYTSVSHLFCNLTIFIKQHGRGNASFAVLRHVMLKLWHATHGQTPHPLPTTANPHHTPWQAHLAALLHSHNPHHHTRLHCLLYAELAAEQASATQLAWLTQQPCWGHCNPWRCPPGRMLVAQAAMVGVIQAAVCLVHSETSQTAAQALEVLELVHASMYSQSGVVDGVGTGGVGTSVHADPDTYLHDSMVAVAAQHPHSGPGSRRYLDMCLLAVEDRQWCRQEHRRYPRRFREAVHMLLLCHARHVDQEQVMGAELGVLGGDELHRVIFLLGKLPLSCWMSI